MRLKRCDAERRDVPDATASFLFFCFPLCVSGVGPPAVCIHPNEKESLKQIIIIRKLLGIKEFSRFTL